MDDLRNISHRAFFGELRGDKAMVAQAAYDIQNLPMSKIENYTSFEALYSTLFRINGIAVYLLLRSMALEGAEAVFRSKESRQKLLEHFFSHYVTANSNGKADRAINDFIRAVSDVKTTDAEDLFYFTGQPLSAVALQFPDNPFATDSIIDLLLADFLDDPITQRDYSEPRNPERHIAVQGEFEQAKQLLRDRIKVSVTGTRPLGVERQEGGAVRMKFPPEGHYLNFEDACLRNLDRMGLERRKKVFQGSVTPLELCVEVGKNIGALGVRLLQFIGLYFELSAQDRRAILEVFDKVRGQTKLQAFTVMQREAEAAPEFKKLFDSIKEMRQMIGGGSIVTVYEVLDKEGRRWAVGVKNPNAEFRTWELLQFANGIIDRMLKNNPGNKDLRLVKVFLARAYEWIIAEINDHRYIEKAARFYSFNDSRTRAPDRFLTPEGSNWRVRVPRIKDTGTGWVHWEEFISGIELAGLMRSDPGARTDLAQGLLSAEDARQVMSLITKNYFHQLFVTGLAHPDVHPGNFIVTAKNEVAILDRKNLFELDDEEKEFLRKLLTGITSGTVEEVTELVSSYWISDPKKSAVFVQMVRAALSRNFDPKAPEQAVAAILMGLEQEGIEVPLKWLLVLKSILGLNRMCQWAGFTNLMEAFLYLPSGQMPLVAPAGKDFKKATVSLQVSVDEDAAAQDSEYCFYLKRAAGKVWQSPGRLCAG